MDALLNVQGLTMHVPVGNQPRTILDGVSLTLEAGEALGLVGESGSGKSMTTRAIARLLPPSFPLGGTITYRGRDVLTLAGEELLAYRRKVAIIFQDPRAHINPVRTIGYFMTEALRTLYGVNRADATDRAVRALDDVGIGNGRDRLEQYPHQLSGGLLQRVMIATMLLDEPELVMADEPTTALDMTTQEEVMAILDHLRRERGLSLLFITHDLDLAAAVCDRTSVMYAGRIVETRPSSSLHDDPYHPYTAALTTARPRIDRDTIRLTAVPGRSISAFEAGDGCAFASRCAHSIPECTRATIPLEPLTDGLVACIRAEELHREHAMFGGPE